MTFSKIIHQLAPIIFLLNWLTASPISAQTQSPPLPQSIAPEAQALLDSARFFYKKGQLPQANAQAAALRELLEKHGATENVEMAEALHYLAGILGDGTQNRERTLRANELGDEGIRLWRKFQGNDSPELAKSLHNQGTRMIAAGKFPEAAALLREAWEIKKKKSGYEAAETVNSMLALGRALGEDGQFAEAEKLILESCRLREAVFGPKHPRTAGAWNAAGIFYFQNGESQRAAAFFEKVLAVYLAGGSGGDRSGIYNNLGMCHRALGDPAKSIRYLQKALAEAIPFYKTEENEFVGMVYNNLGLACERTGAFENGRGFFKKAIEIREKTLGAANPESIFAWGNWAILEYKAGQNAQALALADTALSRCQQFLSDSSKVLFIAREIRALALFRLNRLEESAEIHRENLLFLKKYRPRDGDNFVNTWYNIAQGHNQNLEMEAAIAACDSALFWLRTFPGQQFLPHRVLQLKASSFAGLFEQTADPGQLRLAKKFHREALAAMLAFRHNISPGEDRFYLNDRDNSVFENALANCWKIGELGFAREASTEALDFMEAGKSLALFESMQRAQAIRHGGLPDSLLVLEEKLRLDRTAYDLRLKKLLENGTPPNDPKLLEIQAAQFETAEKQAKLDRFFEKHFPRFAKLKNASPAISLAELQTQLLSPGQTLLEFFMGDSNVFSLLVRRDTAQLFGFSPDEDFKKSLADFREGITDYHARPKAERTPQLFQNSLEKYARAAQVLHQKLLAPLAPLLTDTLLIVQDGELLRLPFEAFLEAAPKDLTNFNTYPFLARRKCISYSFSMVLLREMRQVPSPENDKRAMLALAPFAENDTLRLRRKIEVEDAEESKMRFEFAPLSASGVEALRAHDVFGGKLLLGKQATKSEFLKNAPNFRLLHCSTHAQSLDAEPFVAFFGASESADSSLLFAGEIYNLALRAELLTLSACETALGETVRGEGLRSLARAFAFAGARSLVASLWRVQDAQTAFLMADFYKNLNRGMAKNAALGEAKRQYLKKFRDSGAHPFFWAGFVLIGDFGRLEP